MSSSWRKELTDRSNAALGRFIAEHPAFSVDAAQPTYRGGTNVVTFGRHNKQPVVFKFFVRRWRWRNEIFCLRHFASTGYVPRVLAVVPEQLIVMARLPGHNIGGQDLGPNQKQQASRELGHALGVMAQVDLPAVENGYSPVSDFEHLAWGPELREVLAHYLSICRRVQTVAAAYQTHFFTQSLMLVEQQLDAIDGQSRILFHEDVSNLNVDRGAFQGFYDFEMCRLGTEAMQLGVVVSLCRPHWLNKSWLDWRCFVKGYQTTTGRTLKQEDYLSILAMNHFYHHIRVCRWGEWNGDPADTHHLQASSNAAEFHLGQMREACSALKDWVDLGRSFPSLD